MSAPSFPPPGGPLPPPPEIDDGAALAAFQEAGKTVLNVFFICLRMAHLYDAGNEAFRKPLQNLAGRMDEFMAAHGLLKVMFSEGQIYLNDTRLKVDSSSFEWAGELVEFFTERGVGGLRIEAGLSFADLLTLFQLLVKLPRATPDGPSPRDALALALEQRAIRGVTPLRLMALADGDDLAVVGGERHILGEAIGMYISGLMALRGLAQGRSPSANMLQMTRVVQALADAQAQVGGDLLVLATIKNSEHVLLSHAMNVCVLAIDMGKYLPLSKAQVCDLAIGAMLHDIGKISDEAAGGMVENHPYESYRVIMQGEEMTRSILLRALIALDHHVSFDGSKGYPPYRLGRRPHLFARIVSLADAYDGMTTPTGDGKAMLPDVAQRAILKQAGTLFDPLIAQLFVETLGRYPVGTVVEIDSGDIGLVIRSGSGANRVLRPVVLLLRDKFGAEISGGTVLDLAERHTERKAYKNSIVCSHDPGKMGINVSGYLLEFLVSTKGA